ncbi:MAG: thermostable hemolysin [Cycloclasticus sp.]|nr:thermostable hemolysin [Cycloclasticus sp.]
MSVRKSDIELKITQVTAVEKPQRILLPHSTVDLITNSSPERLLVEQFIASHFYKSHKAQVATFLPYLLTSRNKKNITSTIGFRLGSDSGAFFLEQYLHDNVETTLGYSLGESIGRSKLAEIGNLTSISARASQMLFVLIVAVLYEAGYEWALFTVTPHVQKMVDGLGIVSHQICEANPECLDDGGESWGGYYKNRPKVIAGNLKDAYENLQKHPVASYMICNYQQTTNEIVRQIY